MVKFSSRRVTKASAVRTLNRVRKDLKRGKSASRTGRRPFSRGNATVVLAQGAVGAPKRNFGTSRARGSISSLVRCLDARIPRTLGLPRAVGPYTVIRTTILHKSSAKVLIFSPFRHLSNEKWYDWCGVEDVSATADVTGSLNTSPINMPMGGLETACEVVPASMTVQVMNPAAINNAHGIFAMARVNQQLMLGNSPAGVTWNAMGERIISFYSPRMLTGGKLALKGVKCSSYPLDMSEYASFSPVNKWTGAFTWGNSTRPAALAPIVFVQDNDNPVAMQFMVTIEWRVRFDPGNPATSSHTYHETLPDEAWDGVCRAASEAHGVVDIAEDIATLGGNI